MKKGKATCRALKDIRLQIARENEIDYTPPECTHEGDCSGTCPQCESEVRFLERQLARRRAMGKAVAIIGLAATTALPIAAQTQRCDNEPTKSQEVLVSDKSPKLQDQIIYAPKPNDTDTVTVTGIVSFGLDVSDAAIGATIRVKGSKTLATITDIDGKFTLRVPSGSVLEILYFGCDDKIIELENNNCDVSITAYLEDVEDHTKIIMGGIAIHQRTTIHDDIYLRK